MASERQRIEAFWDWFTKNEPELSNLAGTAEPFWDVALERIKKVDENLRFEMSREREPVREFIVTADGHIKSFPIAERLVQLAPKLQRWAFIPLKPPQGFQFATIYEGTRFDPREMWFLPMNSKSHPTDLGIRIGVPGLDRINKTAVDDAIEVILNTGLGERSATLDLLYKEIVNLPPEPAAEGYIELAELGNYIAWRKRQGGSQSAREQSPGLKGSR